MVCAIIGAFLAVIVGASARDLPEIKAAGELRHLGIPYANFVTGAGDGLDVEIVQKFAESLGLKYKYVITDWDNIIGELTGDKVRGEGNEAKFIAKTEIKGDIAASGITIIGWRSQAMDFSKPTFPTQVWLVSPSDSELKPIVPTGNLEADIALTKKLLPGRSLLCKKNTCLDPGLYHLSESGAICMPFPGLLNKLAPALLKKEADLSLLDVADTLVAFQKWPGQIKVLGPISSRQNMAAAFAKNSPLLREAFDRFLEKIIKDGTYMQLVDNYFPFVVDYYPEFYAFKK
jgi:ABC-type amino acid transport substrate-binding protein